ncbi:HNH endonuclease [Rhizobium sp. 57MFTsu3.2]|uniref:HNH endonuclease n=1 Tax=Rhizobium sp. 57MFTsu3.2 TaxID=1048681 RepID=UPI00146B526B|nr:HNH endonuclease [Rhizobium sp. 57MFTsu3.2]NMN71171.1 HNH endonuclease [Rhizobium sp. 57MFTsu3.2]
MSIWWVNTGARFKAQMDAGVLWCPNRTVRKDQTLGSPQWHWAIIQDVRAGEFVIVARDGFIEGIAIAKSVATPDSVRPATFPETDTWNSIGWSLPIDFVRFDRRVSRADLIEGLFRYKAHRSPFFVNEDGVLEGNQVYLALLPGADAPEFFERVRIALEIQRPGELDRALERAAKDQDDPTKEQKATTRSALVEARIGQGQFRQSLIDMWSGRCCTTGLQELRLLRASHIVGWAAGTEEERLNPYNGLLLSAAFDAAFDAHLITLSATGKWENVAGLSDDELERAGLRNLEQRKVVGLQPKHHEFLARHRQNAHEKWGKVR